MSVKADEVQVCFRCSRASADALTELASENGHGLRGVILLWLAQAGFAEVAQRDLARPDGRRRGLPVEIGQELTTGRGRC